MDEKNAPPAVTALLEQAKAVMSAIPGPHAFTQPEQMAALRRAIASIDSALATPTGAADGVQTDLNSVHVALPESVAANGGAGRDAAPWRDAYDSIDRFLRNNLDDSDYAEYSDALEIVLAAAPSHVAPVLPQAPTAARAAVQAQPPVTGPTGPWMSSYSATAKKDDSGTDYIVTTVAAVKFSLYRHEAAYLHHLLGHALAPAPAGQQTDSGDAQPVAFLRSITHPDWLEECERDAPGAFPVYASPALQPTAGQTVRMLTNEEIDDCDCTISIRAATALQRKCAEVWGLTLAQDQPKESKT